MERVLYGYLLAVNIVTFCAYGIDKYKAKNKKWRIPEKVLIGLAVTGGSAGALAGMSAFHHKTRKNKFRIGVPVIIVLQLIVYFAIKYLLNQNGIYN